MHDDVVGCGGIMVVVMAVVVVCVVGVVAAGLLVPVKRKKY